tara:strand:+ start:839 stop:1069 length:231 start_codon:yes stop_codon:yes gene_type:complete
LGLRLSDILSFELDPKTFVLPVSWLKALRSKLGSPGRPLESLLKIDSPSSFLSHAPICDGFGFLVSCQLIVIPLFL